MIPNTAVYGILGSNISYSLSPTIYRALFHRHKVDAIYNCFDINPSSVNDFLTSARTLPIAGFNVTIPFKESVSSVINRRDNIVKATGSANLVINKRGVLHAYNTDYAGIAATIEDKLKCDIHGAEVAILGSGGSARTVFYYLASKRAASVTVYHRSREREKAFSAWAQGARRHTHYESQMLDNASSINTGCDLCINCTPIALSKLIGSTAISQLTRIFELRYAGTNFKRRIHVDGKYMLAVQAANNFRIMTGIEVEPEDIVRVIRRASR